eukprot:TRINITY_DN399_c2_g1_i1.p2 TRINITY_DN399_c2_g1~~TRINITY_DN399_c2_g1_i1.p2  ORF type:complete len:202 (+),score=54.86 TRINITY_DN399_c2_g1_i1:20-625(+)
MSSLHILQHKIWHVWKFENIEKVKRDEAEAKKKAAAEKKEQIQREREARYERMGMPVDKSRSSSISRNRSPSTTSAPNTTTAQSSDRASHFDIDPEFDRDPHAALPTKNVNFFEEIEKKEKEGGQRGMGKVKRNPQEEKERKMKEEIENRKIFSIHNLGSSSIELADNKPFWFKSKFQEEGKEEEEKKRREWPHEIPQRTR